MVCQAAEQAAGTQWLGAGGTVTVPECDSTAGARLGRWGSGRAWLSALLFMTL